jgi:hypothetical protein
MMTSYKIQLPFTRESLAYLLACGADPDTSPYTHKEIARWCELFWVQFADVDASVEIEQLMPVLADVENQWDHHAAAQGRSAAVEVNWMPAEWFAEWLHEIEKQT